MALELLLHKKNDTLSDNLIVLIHGLGASDSTWRHDGVSWIDLFLTDETFSNLDIAEIKYETSHLANGLLASMGVNKIKLGRFKSFTVGKGNFTTIEILARELKREINSRKIKQYKNVLLIGHSMGGLVAIRYILEELENNQTHNIKGMISLATPYNGSSMALYNQLIKNINKHAQIPSLAPNSNFLDETIRLWQKHLENMKINFKFYFGTEDTIVPENSAIPHIIRSKWVGGIPLPGDHSSILKVIDHSSTNYSHVSEAIKEMFEKGIEIKKKTVEEQRGRTFESLPVEFDKMLAIYEAKIESYLKETRDNMPFNAKSNDDILTDPLLKGFFEDFTWRTKVQKGISDFSRTYNNDPYIKEKNIIPTLQKIRELNLTYPEFKNKLRKEIQTFILDIPETRKTSSYKVALIEILKLMEDRYNKILLITGESGTGKTQLINSIIENYSLEDSLKYFSLSIPLIFNGFNIEKNILKSLNNFFDTDYQTLLEFNQLITSLADECSLKIFFIIDDLQKVCLTEASFYKNLKEFVERTTVFEWINWIISINEFDQYLILDDSQFLEEYCYYGVPSIHEKETDLYNLFINMHDFNIKHNTFEKIMKKYKIEINLHPQLPASTNLNNIEMFRKNPLMCHVYANTAGDFEIEFMNICYLDFVKRYAEIKKKSMVAASKRNLSYVELKEVIEQDITTITEFIMANKKLKFSPSEYESLFNKLNDSYYELRNAQLVIQNRTKINDFFSEDGTRTVLELSFMFKLYWGFKILTLYRINKDWESYSDLRNSFEELRAELLIFELLYLDFIEDKDEEIDRIVRNVLRGETGKEVLFFVFIKMSFTSQAILFKHLTLEDKTNLSRSEVFGLLYYLSNTMAKNIKVPDIFVVLNKYIDDISENDLALYLESIVQRKLARLHNLSSLKKSISQFIFSKDDGINKGISKIAASNFYRVVSEKETNIEDIIKQIITYLRSKSSEIEESKNKVRSVTFIEYFLRYLFTLLIKNSANKLEVHEVLRRTDDYFMDEIKVSHILRSSVTVSYGYIYRTIKFQEKETFKRQYLKSISNLIDSGNILNKKLAYHLTVDTLQDYKDPNTFLEKEFIHILKKLYDDKSLKEFNTQRLDRKEFFERNLSQIQF